MSRLFREALSMESQTEKVGIDPLKAELALESAATQISEAVFDVQMAELQQEELEHAHASLEAMAFSLESLIADDPRGMDRVSAQGYHHAMSAILGDSLPSPVASLEAFGGESECAEATKLSLEGIKDTLKKIWNGIKRSIENAIRAISDFFAKLFGGVKKLQDRIKSMQDDVSAKKKAGAKGNGTVSIPGVDALQLGGKFDQSVLQTGAKVVMDQVTGTADSLQEAAEDYYKGLADFYQKPTEDTDGLEAEHKKAADKITKIKMSTGELPGGKAFEVESKTKGDFETVSVPKLVDFAGKADSPEGDVKMTVMDLGTIEKLLGEAAKFADEMAKKADRREKLKKARQDVSKEADKFVEGSEKKLSDKWNQAKLSWALRSANADFSSTIARIDGYVFKYVRALLAVLAVNVGRYGEASTEDMDDNADGSETDTDTGDDEGSEESQKAKK